MKEINNNPSAEQRTEALEMAKYIITILKGGNPFILFSWGYEKPMFAVATDGSVGLQFRVHAHRHKGLVRVWYNYGADLFSVELITLKGKLKKEFEEVYLDELQNIIDKEIEYIDAYAV